MAKASNRLIAERYRIMDTIWINHMRGFACIAIIWHHWLLYTEHSDNSIFSISETVSGTFVHLFFVLSGCGLAIAYYKASDFSWRKWIQSKINKICIPYWYIICVLFLIFLPIQLIAPSLLKNQMNTMSFISNVLFVRNFVHESQGFNPPLWYMPVIIGLYLSFPFLVQLQKQISTLAFIIILSLVNFGSIYLFSSCGYEVSHQSAIFLFYELEFGIGMIFGRLLFQKNSYLYFFTRFYSLILGLFFYATSYYLTKTWHHGNNYNDAFTALGVFLISLYILVSLQEVMPRFLAELLSKLNRESYFMYLIHAPFIIFIIAPIFNNMLHNIGIFLIIFIVFLSFIYGTSKMLRTAYEALLINRKLW
jgi:peptidoglycan/LPS O-acetylase OafA/YrhL